METRAEKIKMLNELQNGGQSNSELKAICKEVLLLLEREEKTKLKHLITNPFATASQLYEAASDGILNIIIEWIKKDSRPSYKIEIIDGVNYCTPIHYDDKEKPTDWSGHTKELELMEKLLKFKPQ